MPAGDEIGTVVDRKWKTKLSAKNSQTFVPDMQDFVAGIESCRIAAVRESMKQRQTNSLVPQSKMIRSSIADTDLCETKVTLVDLRNRDREIAAAAAKIRSEIGGHSRDIAAMLGISADALVRIETRERRRIEQLAAGEHFVELTARTKRSLNDEGITALTHLLKFSSKTLLRSVPNLGKKGVAEIVALLTKHGLSLLPE